MVNEELNNFWIPNKCDTDTRKKNTEFYLGGEISSKEFFITSEQNEYQAKIRNYFRYIGKHSHFLKEAMWRRKNKIIK